MNQAQRNNSHVQNKYPYILEENYQHCDWKVYFKSEKGKITNISGPISLLPILVCCLLQNIEVPRSKQKNILIN